MIREKKLGEKRKRKKVEKYKERKIVLTYLLIFMKQLQSHNPH